MAIDDTSNTPIDDSVTEGNDVELVDEAAPIQDDDESNASDSSSQNESEIQSGNLPSDEQFNPNTDDGNDYNNSDLKSVVDGMYSSLFSNQEQSAIESRTLGVNEYVGQEPYSTGFGQLRW